MDKQAIDGDIMAPRDTLKTTPKVKTVVGRTNLTRPRSSPVTLKKIMSARKPSEKSSLKVNNLETRQRTNTVPKVSTPKSKENKPVPVPGSVSKSVKKATWKRRPKPAHSGVPVPEKMKKLLQKQLMDSDCSL